MKTALVTGGTGFVAQWTIKQLLDDGHNVITTARSAEKKQVLLDAYKSANLQVEIVRDIADKFSVDSLLSTHKVDCLFAIASPFNLGEVSDFQTELIDPTVQIAENLYQSAAKHGVKRVVYTGSSFTLFDQKADMTKDVTLDEGNWNDSDTLQDVAEAYAIAKTKAEQRVWELLNTQTPLGTVEVVYLHMPWIIGPYFIPPTAITALSQSNVIISVVYQNKMLVPAPKLKLMEFIDGRDLASAQVAAMTSEKAAGKRVLVKSGAFTPADIATALNMTDGPDPLEKFARMDCSSGERYLGYSPRHTLTEAANELIAQIKSMSNPTL